MVGAAYVQPIAGHIESSSYLIVRDANDCWYLWTGDNDQELVAIPERLAQWMRNRPELADLPEPRLWFERSSLPLADLPLLPSIF
jgi:hypothetical protein